MSVKFINDLCLLIGKTFQSKMRAELLATELLIKKKMCILSWHAEAEKEFKNGVKLT